MLSWEETGNISIAHRGLLTRNLTEESVKDLLCELLVEERERKAPPSSETYSAGGRNSHG